MKLKDVFGTYGTSTFVINILKWTYPDECLPGEPGFPTFFHEYIHQLQDTTSFLGAQNFDWLLVQLAALQRIYFHSKPAHLRFSHPGNTNPHNPAVEPVPAKEAIRESQEYLKILNGYHEFSMPFGSIGKYEPIPVSARLHGEKLPVKILAVYGTEGAATAVPLHFGSTIIEESMAYAVECLISKDVDDHPYIPYRIGKDLCEKILDREVDWETFIVVCDASLQCDLPGVNFLEISKLIKARGLPTVGQPKAVLDFLSEHLKNEELEKFRNGIVGDIEATLVQMTNNLKELKPQLDAIADIYRSNLQSRVEDPLYLARSILSAVEKRDVMVLYEAHPAILVIDKENKATTSAAKELSQAAYFLAALFELLEMGVEGRPSACPMVEYCDLDESLDDHECKNKPWSKGRVVNETCPMGVAAISLAMTDDGFTEY